MFKRLLKYLGFVVVTGKPSEFQGFKPRLTMSEVQRMADDFQCDCVIDGDAMVAIFQCRIAFHINGRPFEVGRLNLMTRQWAWS